MRRIVCDASVAFKWTVPGSSEDDAADAIALLEEHLSGVQRIFVPVLFFYEMANILVCGKSRPSVRLIEQELMRLHSLALDVRVPSPTLDVLAAGVARKSNISVYDATYVALAASLRCDLVTADRALSRRLSGKGAVRLLGSSE